MLDFHRKDMLLSVAGDYAIELECARHMRRVQLLGTIDQVRAFKIFEHFLATFRRDGNLSKDMSTHNFDIFVYSLSKE